MQVLPPAVQPYSYRVLLDLSLEYSSTHNPVAYEYCISVTVIDWDRD